MWDLIVSVPDHCLSFYFLSAVTKKMFHTGENYKMPYLIFFFFFAFFSLLNFTHGPAPRQV